MVEEKKTNDKPSEDKKPKETSNKTTQKKTEPKADEKKETKKTTDKKETKVKKEEKVEAKPVGKKEKTEIKTKSEKKTKEEPKKQDKKKKMKKKPKLSNEIRDILNVRKDIKKRTPKFRREEWYRYKRIDDNWRRPDGLHSKMRENLKYRPSRVRVGFRGPKKTRKLHSSGFEEIMVYNTKDLDKINPDIQAARIGKSVGTKKRIDIEKIAEERNIRILNLQHER